MACAPTLPVYVVAMRVLIQNCDSKEYFAGIGEWVHEHARAFAFPSSVDALRFIAVQNYDPVQIVLKFENAKYDCEVSKSEGC